MPGFVLACAENMAVTIKGLSHTILVAAFWLADVVGSQHPPCNNRYHHYVLSSAEKSSRTKLLLLPSRRASGLHGSKCEIQWCVQHICRSATLAGWQELFGRKGMDMVLSGGRSFYYLFHYNGHGLIRRWVTLLSPSLQWTWSYQELGHFTISFITELFFQVQCSMTTYFGVSGQVNVFWVF